ncbi:site-specific integrase [Pseudomonas proteolytica]|nr:site-specific integrase [Pseudomonas proteolytica]USW97422.1 site-specific integrase [Pseudomonas proteolytica]USW98355.1 site-specific integrase [Pseudomonas proteolytica]
MADNLIQKKGESTWYVRLAVPVDVRKAMGGKSVLIQSLKTGLRSEAMTRRLSTLADWKAAIAAAREKRALPEDWQEGVISKLEQFDQIALEQKRKLIGETVPDLPPHDPKMLAKMEADPNMVAFATKLVTDKMKNGLAGQIQFEERLAHLFKRLVPAQLAKNYQLNAAQRTELDALTGNPSSYKTASLITTARLKTYREFRESRGGAPKHVDQQVVKMERLSAFLKKEGLPINFDTVDEWLKSLNRAPATLGQYLMAGTAFWKWAIKYDAAWREEFKDKVNPFVGHELPQGGGSETAGKDREIYTRADTLKLHQAALDNRDRPLADLIALGWYTGARIEELCRLSKDNVVIVDGIKCFDFPKSKSKASKRVVPIHPSLLLTIDRLSEDSTDTFLIPTNSHDHYGKRSHAISKAFGRLRTAAGFTKLHVFHSFRHTVVTELIRADVPDALAKELVGHETGSVTHDVYSKGASAVQKLAAISKLPSLG